MSSAITTAGQARISELMGTEQALVIDRMVLALIPDLDASQAVDRDQQLPDPEYIVHTADIADENKGYVGPDEVVYSIVLSSDLGDFSFNWIGTLEKDTDTVITVTTTPETPKRKTDLASNTTGNCITRNIILAFQNAQAVTGITVTAQTWQFDYEAAFALHAAGAVDPSQTGTEKQHITNDQAKEWDEGIKSNTTRLGAFESITNLIQEFEPNKIQAELFATGYTLFDETATTWEVNLAAGSAIAVDGGIYEAHGLTVDNLDQDKAVVLRRINNDAVVDAFYRDATHPEWTPALWAWQRVAEDDFIDVEYKVPARGAFDIRLESSAGVSAVDPSIDHIIFVECESGHGGDHHPPETPVNATPTDGSVDIQETPTLSVVSYNHTLSTPQGGFRVQISQQPDFSELIHDSGAQPAGISYPVPEGVLSENVRFYWRFMVKDSFGAWSEWSVDTSFTCASAFTYVVTPTNIGPAAGATDISEQPTLSASAFQVFGATDTHCGTQWRIRIDGGDYASPVYDSGEVTDLVSHVVPPGILLEGEKTYLYQERYKGTILGWSDWSQETSFVTKDVFALIIGVALTASGGGAGSWQHIDRDGNNITPGASYFDNHPVWGDMQDVSIDSQAMVKVPKFYCKVGTLAAGDQTGKKAWLISDRPVDGFELHPAFMDAGVEIDQFYYGKYEAADDGGIKVKSEAGVVPLASTSFTDFKTKCAARNTSGVDGFHMVNIYEVAAIQMLALVELCTPDAQSAINVGNNTGSVQNTGVANDIYRGIFQLWSNVYSFVDGLKVTSAGELQVFDKNGNGAYVTVASGLSGNGFTGWPVSMREDSGAYFDCKFLFIAATVDGTEGNGTFADHQFFYQGTEDYIARHGGNWSDSPEYGLFYLGVSSTASSTGTSTRYGARLAKV